MNTISKLIRFRQSTLIYYVPKLTAKKLKILLRVMFNSFLTFFN